MSEVTQNPTHIVGMTRHDVPMIIGDLPGTPAPAEDEDMFGGAFESKPVDPKQALSAMASSGAVISTGHAVAHGCTGDGFMIVPTFESRSMKRSEWPSGATEERDRVEIFLKTGFRGNRVGSIKDGVFRAELDRYAMGWGGVTVMREPIIRPGQVVARPTSVGLFSSAAAWYTKPDRTPTMVPVPVPMDDGRLLWTSVPVYFRRLMVQNNRGKKSWFKMYRDWRSMDSRTGRFSTGARFKQSKGVISVTPGRLPSGAVPAPEVMTWETPFPGGGPYGFSGWHSEMRTVASAVEHIGLLLKYLKSGLHAVTIAAANRPFEDASAEAAVNKLDELGRGEQGLGSLVLINLMPAESGGGNAMLGADNSADRGHLVLHQLQSKLPDHLTDSTLSDALAMRIAAAERIPALLMGRSDGYNFATAAAAWVTTTRLRFRPHHIEHDEFLNSILAEMGVVHWRVMTKAPEWDEGEPLSGVASVAGQLGGVTVNRAVQLLSTVLDIDVDPVEEWWGDLPMPLVTSILESQSPRATAEALGIKLPGSDEEVAVTPEVKRLADQLSSAIRSALSERVP